MWRVSVVGNSGSGKTTLAGLIADRLGVPHIELDGVFHQPGWTQKPREEFRAEVERLTASGGWVVDGNYTSKVADIVWERADAVIWVDPSLTGSASGPRGRSTTVINDQL